MVINARVAFEHGCPDERAHVRTCAMMITCYIMTMHVPLIISSSYINSTHMTTPDANSSVTVNVNTVSNALAVAIQQASSASATVAGNQQHHGSGGATRPVYLQVQVWLAEQPPSN